MSWPTVRTKYVFKRKDIRGIEAPLASATKDGVFLRSDLDNQVWNPGEDVSGFKLVEPGDFVIGLRSFQHGISFSSVRGLVSPAYTVLGSEGSVALSFYKHYFRSPVLISLLDNVSQGIRQGRTIDYEAFSNLPLPVPPIDDQQRIADFLDAEVGRIGSLIAARRSQMKIFEERESSFISERLIPGSIGRVSGEFPWPWLPRAAELSSLVRLGYLCRVQGGITVDASRESSVTDVTRPYLRVANVKAGRLELDYVTDITVPKAVADRSTLQSGDVLMTEGGDIDKLGRGTVWNGELPGALHQNHVFALRPDPERLDAEYLALLTRSLHGRCYFEATGVKSTNLASTSSSKVKSFPIPLISLAEQRKIAAEVNGSLADFGRLRSALMRQVDLLGERKRALITAAVTGQIDVTTARGADLS